MLFRERSVRAPGRRGAEESIRKERHVFLLETERRIRVLSSIVQVGLLRERFVIRIITDHLLH